MYEIKLSLELYRDGRRINRIEGTLCDLDAARARAIQQVLVSEAKDMFLAWKDSPEPTEYE